MPAFDPLLEPEDFHAETRRARRIMKLELEKKGEERRSQGGQRCSASVHLSFCPQQAAWRKAAAGCSSPMRSTGVQRPVIPIQHFAVLRFFAMPLRFCTFRM